MTIRWFFSKVVRQATDMRSQVQRLLNEQRDLLTPQAIQAINAGIVQMNAALGSGTDAKGLQEEMKKLEQTAASWLKPYPNAAIRENIKEFLVAVVVILSFTTFFLQLTKIPTGSMQPTLFGITSEDLRGKPEVPIPGFVKRMVDYWVYGYSYIHVVARADGELTAVEPPKTVFPFIKKQRFVVGTESYTIWFAPDELFPLGTGHNYSGLMPGERFKAGQDILRLRIRAGDHLFVDRFTYNFRRPKRGEIFVFKTKGVGDPRIMAQDQLYIKRLVALGNETVSIGDDRHLVINGKRLDAATRHFESVYTFDDPPRESHYMGHLNGTTAAKLGSPHIPTANFPDASTVYKVPAHSYLAMGDNTMNSYDSRGWGAVPEQNVIGKCFFVYWPLSPRFGWGYR
jgi:signal peptidase I